MSAQLTDPQIWLRLVLTVIAGGLLGLNRGAHGHAAGFRTTILVGLAAAVAMIQADLLLGVGGKAADSFGVMDVMRLPLGILTGVGFIGGGAILRRGNMVKGITTAATLWVMTVIGLCFGGGQLRLGTEATILSLLTLFALKWLDARIPREHHASLVLAGDAALSSQLGALLVPLGYQAQWQCQTRPEGSRDSHLGFAIHWKRPQIAGPPLDLLRIVNEHFAVVSFETEYDEHS
ncbi:MAG TPA: MgtC/SapB family protein [Steroidobacteraceae bacterium]|jgi:putative Mg2+ transporter-C (MgtC) family protein